MLAHFKDVNKSDRDNWDILEAVTQPSVLKLDEILPGDREGERGLLPDSGPCAVTETEKLGPSSLGHIYRGAASRVSEGLFSVVSLEPVLHAHEKYLVPPFLLQVQYWHTGGA